VVGLFVRWDKWLEVSWVMESRDLGIQRRGWGRKYIKAGVVEKTL
jgi:hypothetical protein